MEEDKTPNGTFTMIPNVFLETCELPETAQLLFLRLLRHIGHTGGTFTGSVRKLANLVHMSKSTVDRGVKLLDTAHLICISHQMSQEREQEIMVITLNLDELWGLNRHHCKVAIVPNWDKELPTWDATPINETSYPDLGSDGQGVSENSAQDEEKKNLNTDKTGKTEAPLIITDDLQAFHDLYFASEHHRGSKKIDTKRIEQYRALAPYVTTQEQLTRLVEFARTQLPPNNDGKIWLGNLVSSVDEWRKSEETPQEEENEAYSSQNGVPAVVQQRFKNICKRYSVDIRTYQKRFDDVYDYARFPSTTFKQVMEDACKDAPDIEQFFVKVKRLIVVGY